jgi:hypothetical protein
MSTNHFNIYLTHYFFFEIASNKIDIGISVQDYNTEKAAVVDFTSFVYINEVMMDVCFPRRLKGLYNIARPFG